MPVGKAYFVYDNNITEELETTHVHGAAKNGSGYFIVVFIYMTNII